MDTCQTLLSSALSKHSLIRDVPTFIAELRTSSRLASHVQLSPSPENVLANWTREICGLRPYLLLSESDHGSSYWKMSADSLLLTLPERGELFVEDQAVKMSSKCISRLRKVELTELPMPDEFLQTFPASAIVLGKKLFQHSKWEHRISASGSGLSPYLSPRPCTGLRLRTPSSSDGEGGIMEMREGTGYNQSDSPGAAKRPLLGAAVKMFPTPSARDWRSGKASDETMKKNARPLNEVVVARETYPTPKVPSGGGQMERKTPGGEICKLEDKISAMVGHDNAALSPDWEAWLMGWPTRWTALSPLPKEDFEQWLAQTLGGCWWDQDPANDGSVPRLSDDKTDRVAKLRAQGNGQVPLCVAVAWAWLTGGK